MASSWLKLASSWFKMASCCLELAQVGLKLAPVDSRLAPSWLKLDPRSAPGAPRRLSWRVLGGTWSQEALLEAPEVPKWPPGDSKIHEKSIKLISDLRALASE